MDAPGDFAAIFNKGDNFSGFLFAYLHIKFLLLHQGKTAPSEICIHFQGKGTLSNWFCLTSEKGSILK